MTASGAAVRLVVRGHVQGVGFRWWVRIQLDRLGLSGGATNLPDGAVELVARGSSDAIAMFVAALRGPTAPGRIDSIAVVDAELDDDD